MPSCSSNWPAESLSHCTTPPWKLRQAARCIHQGGVIAYPTEAVYGLGCDPLNGEAVRQLLKLKGRPPDKGLILIAADFDQLLPFVRPLPAEKIPPLLDSWPGPHTWLLPVADNVPLWLTGGRATLAVRVTAHPLAAALCQACGSPLVSSSANRAGRPPRRTALGVQRIFGREIDCILHGDTGGLKRPTTIRHAMTGDRIRG